MTSYAAPADSDRKHDIADLASYRCRSWHWCGCTYADDCLLGDPLPVHDEDQQPYRYLIGGAA